MDLDDEELKATKKLHGIDKENEINKFIGMYNEIKKQSSIIGNIDKDFFIEFADCILGEYIKQKLINNELKQKINNMDIDLTTVYLKGVEDGKDKYKQKIIDKMEKLTQLIKRIKNDDQYSHEIPLYEHDIKLLQELLQEKDT